MLDRGVFRDHLGIALPLMPLAWRALGTGKYDAVLSSHHAFAHSNRLTVDGPHLSYVHAPARYIWTPEIDPRGASRAARLAARPLQRVDRAAATRVTSYAANSEEVAARIARFWNREAIVINPPVRVGYFASGADLTGAREYVLGVGRWIGYKNLHLVVEAGARAGLPVKIAGGGPERDRIAAIAAAAKVPVDLVERPTDDELRELYQRAAVLVFPAVEDFGIVPVEAQAAGTPVVAIGKGGARETVLDGVSGVLTESVDVGELADGIQAAIGMDPKACQQSAQRFSEERFRERLRAWTSSWGIIAEPAPASS
jgi:glycosyltransferase involved in cell wall biosynthesis